LQRVNHSLQRVQRPCLGGSARAPSRSCILSQVSHIQTSGSWSPMIVESSGSLGGGSLQRSRVVTNPVFPMLAQREKVSKAAEHLNEGSINSVQQDMQPTTLVEDQCRTEDVQTRFISEEECHTRSPEPQASLEEECQTENMPPQLILEECQTEDATDIVEAEDCGERVPASATTDEKSAASKDGQIQTEDCGESVPSQKAAEDMPVIRATELTEAEDCGERVPAATASHEKSAVSRDGLVQTQDCGESVPAQIAVEDMPTISTTELTEAEDSAERIPAIADCDQNSAVTMDGLIQMEDCRESVPAQIAAEGMTTSSTTELTESDDCEENAEAYVLTKDSLPELVEVDSSKEQSSWMRNVSWSHSEMMADNGFEPLRKMATTRGLRRGRTADLEVNLSACRTTLEQLKRQCKEHDALTAQSPVQQVGEHPLLEKASSLSERLTDLAAESLECGCNRDVPGAMDVYEQANAYLDAVSDLLQSFTAASYKSESDASWPPLDSYKSGEMSTAPASGLLRFFRVLGS